MLVLTRRKGEAVKIGEIMVVVVKAGRAVRLGISAPSEMKIDRVDTLGDKPCCCRECGNEIHGDDDSCGECGRW